VKIIAPVPRGTGAITFTLGLFRGGVIDQNHMVSSSRSTTWFKVKGQGQRSLTAAILDYPSNILLTRFEVSDIVSVIGILNIFLLY